MGNPAKGIPLGQELGEADEVAGAVVSWQATAPLTSLARCCRWTGAALKRCRDRARSGNQAVAARLGDEDFGIGRIAFDLLPKPVRGFPAYGW